MVVLLPHKATLQEAQIFYGNFALLTQREDQINLILLLLADFVETESLNIIMWNWNSIPLALSKEFTITKLKAKKI